MKLIYLLLFLLPGITSFAGDIDALRTNRDVNQFLAKKVNKSFKDYPPLDDSSATEKAATDGRNRFFKVDMDNNGLTDLVIYGVDHLLVISDEGNSEYRVDYLDKGISSVSMSSLLFIDSSSRPRKIIVRHGLDSAARPDTLISIFHGFVEYNAHPDNDISFEKITITTDMCYGSCPVFEMTVNKDRSATYHAIRYNAKEGMFKGTIPAQKFDELLDILKYIRLDHLENNYKVPWTDDQTATVQISYNGRSKTISDYGDVGTFGLALLYSRFFSWRKSVEWSE